MISSEKIVELLAANGLTFFAGVPDTILKPLCNYLDVHKPGTVCANEGNAVAMAAGYHLATGRIGVCYLQNSGLGNAYNPLMSLMHPEVYAIPVLLLIGWRGEPGVEDEPQHIAQGKATEPTLKALGIPCEVLPADPKAVSSVVARAVRMMTDHSTPFALLVRRNTIAPFDSSRRYEERYQLTREKCLDIVLDHLPDSARIVGSTGKLSRELYELREKRGERHNRDFLTVGSMGHSSSIALGLAQNQPERPVVCFDGDGSLLMHMGALATIGANKPANYYHLVFNNGCHESVGGQPTVLRAIDLLAVAKACGYRTALRVTDETELKNGLKRILAEEGPSLLENMIAPGSRADLGRPQRKPTDSKSDFIDGLS